MHPRNRCFSLPELACSRLLGMLVVGLSLLMLAARTGAECVPCHPEVRQSLPKWRAVRLERTATQQSLELAQLVVAAAEQYALAHGGEFPSTVAQLQPYLPGGEILRNAFTCARTEPIDGAAGSSGQIGYVAVQNGQGSMTGATITVYGLVDSIATLIVPHDRDR